MNTKYKCFAISDNLFYNNGKSIIRLRVNTKFPTIEFLEDDIIEYYNKQWGKQIVEINKGIFDKRLKEILETINSVI